MEWIGCGCWMHCCCKMQMRGTGQTLPSQAGSSPPSPSCPLERPTPYFCECCSNCLGLGGGQSCALSCVLVPQDVGGRSKSSDCGRGARGAATAVAILAQFSLLPLIGCDKDDTAQLVRLL